PARQHRLQPRAGPGVAGDREPAADRGDPVAEALQPPAGGGHGASPPVVSDHHLQDPWSDELPDYDVINGHHDLLLLSFNLAAAAFPSAFGSVVALAVWARRARLLASIGLACSVLGLSAMFANAMLSVPIVLMNGITDRAGLDQLAPRLSELPLFA